MDKLKKGAWLYFVIEEEYQEGKSRKFFSLLPKKNMLSLGNILEKDWTCVRAKLLKDIDVLNITVDIFYNNIIVNRNIENRFIDYRDNTYEKEMNDDIFRCFNYDNIMDNRRDICNYTSMVFKGRRTFMMNRGKKMLNLLVHKSPYYVNYDFMYYGDFLKELGVKAFVYHYGYLLRNNKKEYYDMEIGMTDEKYTEEYIKNYDHVKGDCQFIYKKGKIV